MNASPVPVGEEEKTKPPSPATGALGDQPRPHTKTQKNASEGLLASPRLSRPQVSPRVVSPSYASALGRALSTYREREVSEEQVEPTTVPTNGPPATRLAAPTATTYSTSHTTAPKPPEEEAVVPNRIAGAYAPQPLSVSPLKVRRSSGDGPVTPRTRSPTIGEALAKAMSDVSADGHTVETRPAAARVQRAPQLTPIKPSAPGARASSPSRVINGGGGTPRTIVTPRTRSPTLSESLSAALSTLKEPAVAPLAPAPVQRSAVVEPPPRPAAAEKKADDQQESSAAITPRSRMVIRAQPIYPSHSTKAQPQRSEPQDSTLQAAKRTAPPPPQTHDLIPKFQRYVRPKVLKTEETPAAPAATTTTTAPPPPPQVVAKPTATGVREKPKPRPRPAVVAHYPKKTALVPTEEATKHPQPAHADTNGWDVKEEKEKKPPQPQQPVVVETKHTPVNKTTAAPPSPPPPVAPASVPVAVVSEEVITIAVAEVVEVVQPEEKITPVPQSQPDARVVSDSTPEAAAGTEERPNARSPRTRYAVRTVKPSFASALGRVIIKQELPQASPLEPPQDPVELTPAETQSPTSPPPSIASVYQSLIWHKDKDKEKAAASAAESTEHSRTSTPPLAAVAAEKKTGEAPNHHEATAAAVEHPDLSRVNSGWSTPPPPPPPTTPAAAAPAHELPVPIPVEPVEVVHHTAHETPTTMSVKRPMVLSKGAYVIRRKSDDSNAHNASAPATPPPAKKPVSPPPQSPPSVPPEAPTLVAAPIVTLPAPIPAKAAEDSGELPYEKRYMKFLRADWSLRSKNTASSTSTTSPAPKHPASATEKTATAAHPSHIQVLSVRKTECGDGATAMATAITAAEQTSQRTPRASASVSLSQKSGAAADWRDVKYGAPRGNREDPSRRFHGRKTRDHEDVGAWHGCQPGAWDGRPRHRNSLGHKARSSSLGKAEE